MDEQELKDLLIRYQAGNATEEEKAFLENWYNQYRATNQDDYTLNERLADAEAIWNDLQPVFKEAKKFSLWPRIAAAASILLMLSFGGYFLLHKPQPPQIAQIQPVDIKPGSKKAILKLSNGKEISLTDAQAGTIAKQGNTMVTKTTDGQVVYSKQEETAPAETVYNTITTPRAGYYPLKMADGTIAILDAQSSIRYPVTFNGTDRTVEITGQVYFEVKHDAAHPFKVIVRGQTIEDIGTTFNINAYEDEPVIRTTLVEGGIKLRKGDRSVLLKPGQQALTAGYMITVKEADTEEAIAWKNGQTSFKNGNVQEIMREVSRWYDVEITYEGIIPEQSFTGGIPRNSNLSSVLKVLQLNNIHFATEGRKIIMKP